MLNRLISTNLFYFKSNWVDIRAAAPMFIGKAAGVLLPSRSSGFAWVSSPQKGCVPVPVVLGMLLVPALLGGHCGRAGLLETARSSGASVSCRAPACALLCPGLGTGTRAMSPRGASTPGTFLQPLATNAGWVRGVCRDQLRWKARGQVVPWFG